MESGGKPRISQHNTRFYLNSSFLMQNISNTLQLSIHYIILALHTSNASNNRDNSSSTALRSDVCSSPSIKSNLLAAIIIGA